VWVFALAVTGQGLAMFLGGILEKRIGTRLATLIGGLTTRLQSILVSAAGNILYVYGYCPSCIKLCVKRFVAIFIIYHFHK